MLSFSTANVILAALNISLLLSYSHFLGIYWTGIYALLTTEFFPFQIVSKLASILKASTQYTTAVKTYTQFFLSFLLDESDPMELERSFY